MPMRFLGINAIFHDPAAALVVDGEVVAAAEERFSRRKHGKRPVPFSAWELPEQAAARCPRRAGSRAEDLDGVAYSYDPELMYEEVTAHLGFLRSCDEYKVMALAAYGEPRHLGELRELIHTTGDGGFHVDPIDWSGYAKAAGTNGELTSGQADLAAGVQRRLEEPYLVRREEVHTA
jgi:predicted NodU family carbamoyl transferase